MYNYIRIIHRNSDKSFTTIYRRDSSQCQSLDYERTIPENADTVSHPVNACTPLSAFKKSCSPMPRLSCLKRLSATMDSSVILGSSYFYLSLFNIFQGLDYG